MTSWPIVSMNRCVNLLLPKYLLFYKLITYTFFFVKTNHIGLKVVRLIEAAESRSLLLVIKCVKFTSGGGEVFSFFLYQYQTIASVVLSERIRI